MPTSSALAPRPSFLHIIIFYRPSVVAVFFVALNLIGFIKSSVWHKLRLSTARANPPRPLAERYAATTSTARDNVR